MVRERGFFEADATIPKSRNSVCYNMIMRLRRISWQPYNSNLQQFGKPHRYISFYVHLLKSDRKWGENRYTIAITQGTEVLTRSFSVVISDICTCQYRQQYLGSLLVQLQIKSFAIVAKTVDWSTKLPSKALYTDIVVEIECFGCRFKLYSATLSNSLLWGRDALRIQSPMHVRGPGSSKVRMVCAKPILLPRFRPWMRSWCFWELVERALEASSTNWLSMWACSALFPPQH